MANQEYQPDGEYEFLGRSEEELNHMSLEEMVPFVVAVNNFIEQKNLRVEKIAAAKRHLSHVAAVRLTEGRRMLRSFGYSFGTVALTAYTSDSPAQEVIGLTIGAMFFLRGVNKCLNYYYDTCLKNKLCDEIHSLESIIKELYSH